MTLTTIKQLPDYVANQIAAGEVVERPLSVIKELLENALDANATSIQVDIEKGGLALCRVRDNGEGIAKDQLPLAIAPHATSKISSVDDLMCLHSLGFRGEALASISSVSRFKIISKPKAQPHAFELCIEGAEHVELNAAAHPNGTTIEVRDLFYNVPVRRTFLKSAKTEFLHIESIVKKIALSRFDLSINLSHNGKTSFNLPMAKSEANIHKRLSLLLGKPFMDMSHYFCDQKHDFILKGWLGSPDYLRSQNDLQYIFLNGRMVKDKLLLHAVRRVYEPYLYPGRAACFLLYFELPPSEVDVNVHPTKHEVRFKSPRSIHDFFISVLTKHLDYHRSKKDTEMTVGVVSNHLENEHKTKEIPPQFQNEVSTLSNECMPFFSSDMKIVPLNKTHGLFLFKESSFILNVLEVYKKQLEMRLIQLEKPLASRPVLVPLMVQLSSKTVMNFPFEKARLYGFEIMALSENTVAVRGFPVVTPHLDIQSCIHHMGHSSLSFELIIASAQCVSLSLLNDSEQNNLIQFVIKQEQEGVKDLPYRCLSENDWQEILNEK